MVETRSMSDYARNTMNDFALHKEQSILLFALFSTDWSDFSLTQRVHLLLFLEGKFTHFYQNQNLGLFLEMIIFQRETFGHSSISVHQTFYHELQVSHSCFTLEIQSI